MIHDGTTKSKKVQRKVRDNKEQLDPRVPFCKDGSTTMKEGIVFDQAVTMVSFTPMSERLDHLMPGTVDAINNCIPVNKAEGIQKRTPLRTHVVLTLYNYAQDHSGDEDCRQQLDHHSFLPLS